MFDVALCDDCGLRFDALQATADALEEQLPLAVLLKELCGMCLHQFRSVIGL